MAGVSGNPSGKRRGTKNAITILRLDTEAALRDILAPRAKKLIKKAIEIAMNDKHPGQVKMLQVLLDKTLASMRTEDAGEDRDTNINVNINDMTLVARTKTSTRPAVTEGEFTEVVPIPRIAKTP